MITEDGNEAPPISRLVRKTLGTALGALQNRGELLMVELQEEKGRAVTLVIFGLGALFLAMVTVLLLTGTIIFLFAEQYRIYVAGAFTFLYFAGTVAAALAIKSRLKQIPFSESLRQLRKDRQLLDAFE